MPENVLKKLIYAWREAKNISDGLEKTFGISIDAMYDVHGNILDALREYAFEKDDLNKSEILEMLNSSKMPPAEVARRIQIMHDFHMLDCSPMIKQPTPKFFTDEQIERMQRVFGGYVHDAK